VYDVQNIPSWKEVHLIELLKPHFDIPIYMNNDANCYALGEAYFGQGIECEFFVGLTIGTGLGAGIIYNKELINGSSGASGEFGILPYKEKTLEDYCSGQFFETEYGITGVEMFARAKKGDKLALDAFNVFGYHLGNAVKIIMSTVDPQRITIGGSVAQSNEFFKDKMWETIRDYSYQRSVDNIQIAFSDTNNRGMLGAASLCFDSKSVNV
jgi:glucokinase